MVYNSMLATRQHEREQLTESEIEALPSEKMVSETERVRHIDWERVKRLERR